eukprot:4272040-Prymnesium_polylepis.1
MPKSRAATGRTTSPARRAPRAGRGRRQPPSCASSAARVPVRGWRGDTWAQDLQTGSCGSSGGGHLALRQLADRHRDVGHELVAELLLEARLAHSLVDGQPRLAPARCASLQPVLIARSAPVAQAVFLICSLGRRRCVSKRRAVRALATKGARVRLRHADLGQAEKRLPRREGRGRVSDGARRCLRGAARARRRGPVRA